MFNEVNSNGLLMTMQPTAYGWRVAYAKSIVQKTVQGFQTSISATEKQEDDIDKVATDSHTIF